MMSLTRRLVTLLLGVALLSGAAMSSAHADPPDPIGHGQPTAWGETGSGQTDIPASLTDKNVTALAAGAYHSLALTDDGTVTAWGYNGFGQTDVPSSLAGKNVTAIAAGEQFSLALTDDGTVTAWGDDYHDQTTVPASLAEKNVTAISAGGIHSLALADDGTVTGWGNDLSGQASVPSALAGKNVTAIAAGGYHSLALTDDGTITVWGNNSSGQGSVPSSLAGKTVTAISGGTYHCLALTDDGTITAWGAHEYGQISVPASLADQRVTAIDAGAYHSLAIYDAVPGISTGLVDDAATVTAGSSITVTPTVANAVAAATTEWTASGTHVDSEIDQATGAITLTSTSAGTHDVTITIPTSQGTLTAVAHLTVTPAAFDALNLHATPSSVQFGDTVTYTAAGADAYGNATGDETSQVTFTSSNPADTIDGADVTAGSSGPRTITATHTTGVIATQTLTIGPRTFATGPAVTITGTIKVGQPLTAEAGTVSPAPDSITWQWSAGGSPITGATAAVFTPTSAQLGTRLSVSATAHRNGYTDVTSTAQTPVVVTRQATTLNVTTDKRAVVSGKKATITTRGLDAHEPFTIQIDGRIVDSGTADASGTVTRKISVTSARTEHRTITVTGGEGDRTGLATITVTRKPKLALAKTRIKASSAQRITVRGLLPGEKITLTYRGKRITPSNARANQRGVYSKRFNVGRTKGTTSIAATGATSGKAKAAFKVR